MQKHEVKLYPRALRDLYNIYRYIWSQYSIIGEIFK